MARVLIIYGTTDGQTHKVAEAIAARLSLGSIHTDVVRAGAFEPLLSEYDAIVAAGSVHAGRYQKRLTRWLQAHARELDARPAAFVSVSLAVLQKGDPKTASDLAAIVERLSADTGWRPGTVKHVAGALLYRRYNIFKRWVMKRIVAKAGGDTDTSKDYEYTDWADVAAFADEFRRRLAAAA